MSGTKQQRVTHKIELVETHNIALSLGRLSDNYDTRRWKRALYHALSMSSAGSDRELLARVRVALELP